MRLTPSEVWQVKGCIPFDLRGQGFALPIFGKRQAKKAFYVQEVDEASGRIVGFKKLEAGPKSIVSISDDRHVGIGLLALYAFLSEDLVAFFGHLEELEPAFRSFLGRCPDDIATRLQISELIGSDGEKRAARLQMQESIFVSSGASAAHRFYEGSLLRSALWNRVASLAKDAAAFEAYRHARSRLRVRVDEMGQIDVDLSALDLSCFPTLNKMELVRELEVEFDGVRSARGDASKKAIQPPGVSQQEIDFDAGNKVEDVLRSIQAAGKQEERLVILLRTVLKDRLTGIQVLKIYKRDRASYASEGISELIRLLDSPVPSGDSQFSGILPRLANPSDQQLLEAVWRPFSRGLSVPRANLLFYMAQYLADIPSANFFAKQKLDKSRSYYVEPIRDEIYEMLRKGNDKFMNEQILR
jgi:hypothetical protein